MAVGKKARFEVFKRDKFTCQYCGRSSPDVVLECDHVLPKARGGKNSLLSLVTSCYDCNRGKGAVELSDDAAVVRQRKQLAELQARRDQVAMMVEWQNELAELDLTGAQAAEAMFHRLSGFHVTRSGLQTIKGCVRRFGLAEVLEATRIACGSYLQYEGEKASQPSADDAFRKIGGICYNRKRDREEMARG